MKKIVLSLIIFAFAANVSAQLKVNPFGKVGIGANSAQEYISML